MDLLKKPWILGTLKAAFRGCPNGRSATKDGELAITRDKTSFVQLTNVKSLEPPVATFSDRSVRVTAEFTESCLSVFLETNGKPLTALRGGTFKLVEYKFVFRYSDAALFEAGITLKQQLEDRKPGISLSENVAMALTSNLRMIVEEMVFLGGEGNPIAGNPTSIGRVEEIRQLLRQIPVRESLLPTAQPTKRKPGSKVRISSRRYSEDIEHGGGLSSQLLLTQAPAAMHYPSEDDSQSVVSQDFVEEISFSQFATQAHQQRRSKLPQSINAPPSSPPLQQSPLHPGWEGMTEVTAQIVNIPKDQRQKLAKPESWWPPTGSQDIPGNDNFPNLQPVYKGPPRTRVVPRPSSSHDEHPPTLPRAESEELSYEEAMEWPTSPVRSPGQLQAAMVAPINAAPSPRHGLPPDVAEISGRPPPPISGAQDSQESQESTDDSSSKSSDDEAMYYEPPGPMKSPRSCLLGELEAAPPSSVPPPSSPNEASEQGFQPASKSPDPQESTKNLPDETVGERLPTPMRAPERHRRDVDETLRRSPVLERESPMRPSSLQGGEETRTKYNHTAIEAQFGKGLEAKKKSEADYKPDVGDSLTAYMMPTHEFQANLEDGYKPDDEGGIFVEDEETTAHRKSRNAITSNSELKRKPWAAKQTARKTKRVAREDSQKAHRARKPSRGFKRSHEYEENYLPHQRGSSEEPPPPVRDSHGSTLVDRYGISGAQKVENQRGRRRLAKRKKRLKGKIEFQDIPDRDDGELEDREVGGDVNSDNAGLGGGLEAAKVAEEDLSDREDSCIAHHMHMDVQTSSRVVLTKGSQQRTQDSEDDDIPCAPAKASTQVEDFPLSSAKVSGSAGNGRPPSALRNLGPIIQVKATPGNPFVPGEVQPFKSSEVGAEETIPPTIRQQSGSMESRSKLTEILLVCSTQMPLELDRTQESNKLDDKQTAGMDEGTGDVEVPGTQAEYEHNDDGSPQMVRQAPQKLKANKEILKSTDFASQEIRNVQDDIPVRIETEHRSFLVAHARNDSRPMSSTPKQESDHAEILWRNGGPPGPSIREDAPSTVSKCRKRPASPALTPAPIKKARIDTHDSAPRSGTFRNLAATLEKLPVLPPPRPQLPLYIINPRATSGPSPLSIEKPNTSPKRLPAQSPPLPAPPPPEVNIIDSDSDSEAGNSSDVVGLCSPPQPPSNALYVPKRGRETLPEVVDAEGEEVDGEEEEEDEKEVEQPPSPHAGLYAGYRPRSIRVPGYETLSEGQLNALEMRRRRFFGKHREVEPFIGTPGTSKGEQAAAAAAMEQKSSSQWSGNRDQWWMDEDTPMRHFVRKFKELKSVKKELGGSV